jgi:hypothetical protein
MSDVRLVNALSSCCLQHLDSLCSSSKGGKSNLFGFNIKYSVVVDHEGRSQDPGIDIVPLIFLDTAKAIAGTLGHETTVEVLRYGEGNAIKVEYNVRENGVARVNVESSLNSYRTRDLVVDCMNIMRITMDDGGSL